jgi:hypothetical protein
MRVIGFDKLNRPIMYSNFIHAEDRFNAESCVHHLIVTLEDCTRYMRELNKVNKVQADQWIWVCVLKRCP